MSYQRFLHEAMTADDISSAQSEHYQLDDSIRRMVGRLTADQKRKIIDQIQKMITPKEG